MKLLSASVLVLVAAIALSGCNLPSMGKKEAPTGQVVARVGDHEITLRDLRAEMGNTTYADPKARKAAEQSALNNIIGRTILADAARKQGLEKTPDFDLQKRRVIDELLVQTLQQKTVQQIPQPTRQDASDFVTSHPDMFAERKIFVVDQIRMPRPSDPNLLKVLEPLKTLDDVEIVLKNAKVPYERSGGSLDSVGADPTMVAQILKLPPNEVFVIPGGPGLLVNQIRETKVVPLNGDVALDAAMKLITRQRTQETVQKAFGQLMGDAAKSVQFNKDYAPPKPDQKAGGPGGPPPAAPAKGK